MNRTFVALSLAVAVFAAVAVLDAQQAVVSTTVQQPAFGGPVHLKPPALLKQFVGGGRWQSQGRIDSLSHWVIDSLGSPGPAAAAGAGWQVQLKHDAELGD